MLVCLNKHACSLLGFAQSSLRAADQAVWVVCRAAGIQDMGYTLLPDGDFSMSAKKRQEHFEAETERILMDTYNSLYKCQEFIPMVS